VCSPTLAPMPCSRRAPAPAPGMHLAATSTRNTTALELRCPAARALPAPSASTHVFVGLAASEAGRAPLGDSRVPLRLLPWAHMRTHHELHQEPAQRAAPLQQHGRDCAVSGHHPVRLLDRIVSTAPPLRVRTASPSINGGQSQLRNAAAEVAVLHCPVETAPPVKATTVASMLPRKLVLLRSLERIDLRVIATCEATRGARCTRALGAVSHACPHQVRQEAGFVPAP
jgi:hypothetical protein